MSTAKGNAASAAQEKLIQRNPHPDFDKVQGEREAYPNKPWQQYKTPQPDWAIGGGANKLRSNGDGDKKHIAIDPYEDGRPAAFNYKLLISAIVPRPIGLLSTLSADGKSANLAPFSYTQMLNHDPPIFVVGFAGSVEGAKDSLKNLLDTKEAVLNIVSDTFVEAINYTSINAPLDVSEWDLSGLTQAAGKVVKAAFVKESVFAVEARLVEYKEWKNKQGKVTGVSVFLEGVQFHAREDALNADRNLLDPAVLRPVGRLGGITYATCDSGFELLRPDFDKEATKDEVQKLINRGSKLA